MAHGKTYYVYILSNFTRTLLSVGYTDNIYKKIKEHKNDEPNATNEPNFQYQMYYEVYSSRGRAIGREKQLTYWESSWKMKLIRKINPVLKDLAKDWFNSEVKEDFGSGLE